MLSEKCPLSISTSILGEHEHKGRFMKNRKTEHWQANTSCGLVFSGRSKYPVYLPLELALSRLKIASENMSIKRSVITKSDLPQTSANV